MDRIVNGAPMVIMRGIEDISTKRVTYDPEAIPQHLAKVYFYAQKGPTDPQLVVGNSAQLMYGAETFNELGAYCNHATVLFNTLNGNATAVMGQRVIPKDAGPKATIRLWLDLLKTKVPEYKRNSDGSIATDANGKITTGVMIDGYIAKWVVTKVDLDTEGASTFGRATQVAGDQVDAATSTQSIRYPWKDFEVYDFGADGNLRGIRLWAPTESSSITIDSSILDDETIKCYPLRMSCMYKSAPNSTPKYWTNINGEQYIDVCLKEGVLHPTISGKRLYMPDVFPAAYQDIETEGATPIYAPFGRIHLYQDNIEENLKALYAAEKPYIDGFSDFTGADDEEYRFNAFGGVSSMNVPYHSYVLNTSDANAVRLSDNAIIYAAGGSDGTMNDTLFAELVEEAIADYADPNAAVQDIVENPEKVFYDSGFPVQTKLALFNFIAERKDTALVVGTAVAGAPALSLSDEQSIAIALRTRGRSFPESEYYGTSACRFTIINHSGVLLNSSYSKRLPLTIQLAKRSAKYMGAGDRKWKSEYNFDHSPLNEIDMFSQINASWHGARVRNKNWDIGLNTVASTARRRKGWEAIKTAYDDDTSVLNSWITVLACCELQRIGAAAHRKFSGESSMTDAELLDAVEKFVNEEVEGLFDNRFKIIPEAYYEAGDKERGYSWSLRIKIGAPSMRTVETLSIQSVRLADLETAAA